ncbi:D-beta-hydroxybutyrate dehydrogenase, mitochondrial [Zootermopsis nevadensis]|uniref:D-beta-hydroxybutyrate dehydrogenase, mitochondrial n=1 Tax=Zootermopsis nevadensis TaxID=136037 RepID=A0A067RU64_ZOONE|nr:D-beta-hydroxybutyrate dehydrogenase, mitochondrial [Zootermopsis nevadensis]KDR23384.1 D-beta-hydroxybutyrate dehydrogenase, mitochondrial [Zootermopsis nevadensis]
MGKNEELPWDLFDRCLLPVIFSHAAAVILSTILNTLYISQISTFTLFLWFVISSLGAVFFYHNLKVTAAGKTILITDCTSRIGYTTARQLDDLGFTVFAGFQDKDRGSESAKKLKKDSSGRLHILQLDVTSEKQILAAAAYVKENLPHGTSGLWAVVNSATWASFGEVEWVPFDVYKQSTDVNLLSVIRITQVFLPLVRRTKGRIINIVSILGRIASPLRSPYCTVKFGVEAFSDCLRLEMRRWGVDVIVVEPGDYTTGNTWFTDEVLLAQARDMWKSMSYEARAEYGEDYFEQSVRSLQTYTKGEETDLTPVLRSLTDAVCRTFPLSRYTSVTRSEKLQAFVADHFPRSVYDIIYT